MNVWNYLNRKINRLQRDDRIESLYDYIHYLENRIIVLERAYKAASEPKKAKRGGDAKR